jgi:hypothetical protein
MYRRRTLSALRFRSRPKCPAVFKVKAHSLPDLLIPTLQRGNRGNSLVRAMSAPCANESRACVCSSTLLTLEGGDEGPRLFRSTLSRICEVGARDSVLHRRRLEWNNRKAIVLFFLNNKLLLILYFSLKKDIYKVETARCVCSSTLLTMERGGRGIYRPGRSRELFFCLILQQYSSILF